MASFLVFGVFLGPVLADLTWEIVAYGVLSLTVVRMVAVAFSLLGSGLRSRSVLYIGWFGPRGLATIILTLEVVDESHLIGGPTIADAALFTVALSVLAHGLTAWWGSNTYAEYIATHPDAASLAEHDPPARRRARAAAQPPPRIVRRRLNRASPSAGASDGDGRRPQLDGSQPVVRVEGSEAP